MDDGKPIVIEFTIPGIPVAQPRARAAVRAGHAVVYGAAKSHPIHAFKAMAKLAASNAYAGAPIAGPIRFEATFVFPRPKAMIWKTRPMPRRRHVIKPDRDNAEKGLLDALRGLLFNDDCQVCCGEIEKWVASGHEQPHVLVRVTELDNGEQG